MNGLHELGGRAGQGPGDLGPGLGPRPRPGDPRARGLGPGDPGPGAWTRGPGPGDPNPETRTYQIDRIDLTMYLRFAKANRSN